MFKTCGKSGESELHIMKRVRKMYHDEHNTTSFNNEDAWDVLRAHKKWDAPEALDLTMTSQAKQTRRYSVIMTNHVRWEKNVLRRNKNSRARQVPEERVPAERAR